MAVQTLFSEESMFHSLQHRSVLFMPNLDPFLPLILGKLVLVQDSAGREELISRPLLRM